MTNEFTVVGEHRDDATQLLVVGADGKYYGYAATRDQFSPVEPDDQWVVKGRSDDLLAASVELPSASS